MAKKILRKLTLKDIIGGKPDVRILPQDGSVKHLAMIYGTAIQFSLKSSDKGDYILFLGQFKGRALEGKNLGDEFVSGKAILPTTMADLIAGSMGNGETVDFAFKIGVHYDETAITSYVYDVEPVMDHGESAAMQAIEQRLGFALPAPKVDTATGETSAPAAESHAVKTSKAKAA